MEESRNVTLAQAISCIAFGNFQKIENKLSSRTVSLHSIFRNHADDLCYDFFKLIDSSWDKLRWSAVDKNNNLEIWGRKQDSDIMEVIPDDKLKEKHEAPLLCDNQLATIESEYNHIHPDYKDCEVRGKSVRESLEKLWPKIQHQTGIQRTAIMTPAPQEPFINLIDAAFFLATGRIWTQQEVDEWERKHSRFQQIRPYVAVKAESKQWQALKRETNTPQEHARWVEIVKDYTDAADQEMKRRDISAQEFLQEINSFLQEYVNLSGASGREHSEGKLAECANRIKQAGASGKLKIYGHPAPHGANQSSMNTKEISPLDLMTPDMVAGWFNNHVQYRGQLSSSRTEPDWLNIFMRRDEFYRAFGITALANDSKTGRKSAYIAEQVKAWAFKQEFIPLKASKDVIRRVVADLGLEVSAKTVRAGFGLAREEREKKT